MLGVIVSVDTRCRHAVVSAPHFPRRIQLVQRDFLTDVEFNRRLIGRVITFDLREDNSGRFARNAWLTSCDFMAVATGNRSAAQEVSG